MSEKKLTAAFLMSGVGLYRRGAEMFFSELRTRLADSMNVVALTRAPAGDGRVHVRAMGRDSRVINALNRSPGIGQVMRACHLGPINLEWATASLGAYRWLLRHEVDVFIPEAGRWGGLLGQALRRRKGIPFVDIGHGALSRWEIAAARCKPDCYVATTRVSEGLIRKKVPDLKTVVIPMGVDASLFRPDVPPRELALERPVFLGVGTMEGVKRFHLTIAALRRLGKGSLLLAGEGPLQESVDRHAREALGPRRYLRVVARPAEMPGLYAAADVFASASASEAFGLVYLEAMACNRPVVTEDDAIRREVVGEAGLFCDCADEEAYARALDAALRQPRSTLPRLRACNYDWSIICSRYAELFRSVAIRPRTGSTAG